MLEYLRVILAVLPAAALWMAGLGRAKESMAAGMRCRLVAGAAWIGLAASLLGAILAIGQGPQAVGIGGHCLSVGIYLDNLSLVMLTLVSFLAVLITRFSVSYLGGHPRQHYFMTWLSRTIAAVLTLVVVGNLLLFALAWAAMSLCLHQLLTFNCDRPAAMLAARKKFIVSRCGDMCLITALVIAYFAFGSWQFQAMFAEAHVSSHAEATDAIAWLLVIAACLKSAQFPFHSWLPDTMETPTPVSALMHAGIINAGGFLLIRFAPLLLQCPVPLMVLAVVGVATALTGSLAMMTQTNIKRQLAYSTVAQMGFMMLECGLGAFGLALLHLVAHGLYKSHSFLSSGSTVKNAPIIQFRRLYRHHHFAANWTALAATVAMLGAGAWLTLHGKIAANQLPLLTAAGISWCLLVWRAVAGRYSQGAVMRWTGGLAIIAAAYPLLASVSALLINSNQWVAGGNTLSAMPAASWTLSLLISAILLVMGVLQWQIISGSKPHWMQSLYVHALNGFYIGIIANRITTWVWSLAGSMLAAEVSTGGKSQQPQTA